MILSVSSGMIFGFILMAIGLVFILLFKDKDNSGYTSSKRLARQFRDRVLDSTHGFSYLQKEVRNTFRGESTLI